MRNWGCVAMSKEIGLCVRLLHFVRKSYGLTKLVANHPKFITKRQMHFFDS